MNALKTKENRFGILHLNITSLYKHVDGLSNLSFKLDEIKFSNYRLEWTRNRIEYSNLNILLNKNLESTFIVISLPK